MKDMLIHASENNYAVMAINCVDMEQVMAAVYAAEEEKSAVIIDISPRQMKAHAIPQVMVSIVKTLAQDASVPVALNLDHGAQLDDINEVMTKGYSSVMVDASSLDFEENVRRTKLVATLAHAKNLSCEAELGHVGLADNADDTDVDLYTNVAKAKEFVDRTHCDALAVAIGTAHGSYPKDYIPKLDFARLEELKKELKMPLVLHGGSGAGEENLKKVVSLGINKINVCTDLMKFATKSTIEKLNENPSIDYMDLQIYTMNEMKMYIKKYMRLIGSSNRYCFSDIKVEELD
jgi:fructose-bisphosphate aldolase class II